MCKAAAAQGYRPAVLISRGCAGLKLLNDQVYSATFTDDAHLTVETISRAYPDAKITLVGFSLGSIILTKYLAEVGHGLWKHGTKLGWAAECPFYSLLHVNVCFVMTTA